MTTTDQTAPAAPAVPAEVDFAALLRDPANMAAFAQALAAQKEADTAAAAARFASLGDSFELLVSDIAEKYELETWHKKDRKTGKKTDEVSGRGYHVTGPLSVPITLGGRTYKIDVNLWVRVSGSAPDVTASGDEA